jgi:microcystin-dependent protein
MAIQLRTNKASALTYNEMDRNFSSFFYSASIDNGNMLKLWYTGSSTLNTAPGDDFGPARFVPIDLQPTTGATPTLVVAGDPRTIQFRHSTNPILDADNGFLYNTAQQLGIGVSLPAANAKIHAKGTNAIPATLRLESTVTVGTNRRAAVDFYQGTTLMGTIGRHDHNDNNLYIKSWAPSGKFAELQDPGHIRFVVGSNANYGAFTQAGFGIGTFSPQHLFHAEGNGFFAGRLGVGTGPGSAALHVFQTAQTGTLLGDFQTIAQFGITPQQNVDSLKILSVRQLAGGGDWLSNGMRIQQDVDGSYRTYIQFSGQGNLHGFSIGTGQSTSPHAPGDIGIEERLRIDSYGNISMNKSIPNAKLDVNGDTIVTGSFTVKGNTVTTGTAAVGLSLTTGTSAAVGTNLTVGNIATILNVPASVESNPRVLTVSQTAGSIGQIQYITGTFPLGGIVMWAGSPTAPPAGWTLCDGRAPVGGVTIPDLRERFIVGAGGKNNEVVTYDFTTFTINSNLTFNTGNSYVQGTFTKVSNTSMVTNPTPSTAVFNSNMGQSTPGTPDIGRQYALYSLVGNSANTSYFLVYHQGLDNYVLYRGYVPANGTNVTTGYPYVLFPPGSIAVLSQTGNLVTHRPNISTIQWVADINGYTVGEKGGFNNVKLHTSEMPSHNHGFTRSWRDNGDYGRGLETGDTEIGTQDFPTPPNEGNIHFTGGNFPHENRPPYYALAFIIYTGA